MKLAGLMTGLVAIMTAGVMAQQNAPAAAGDQAAIAKVRTAYQAALAAQDGAALSKLFAPDGVELPPNAPAARGRAGIQAYHKAFAQQMMVHGVTITPTSTQIFGDHAIDVGSYAQTLMSMQNGGMIKDKGKYLVVLMKDKSGQWWVADAIYNSDMPLPGPPAKK